MYELSLKHQICHHTSSGKIIATVTEVATKIQSPRGPSVVASSGGPGFNCSLSSLLKPGMEQGTEQGTEHGMG